MKGFYNAFYIANVVFQAVFSLLFGMGGSLFIAWLLVDKLSFPVWTYAVAVTVGTLAGGISMIRFVLQAMTTLEGIEKQKKTTDSRRRKNERNERNEEK